MTVSALPTAPIARVRTVCAMPVRQTEPPYDDERPVAPVRAGQQDALALAFAARDGLPALRLVPALPSTDGDLPPARAWAARLVQAVLEVLTGERSAAQLVRWTAEPVYAQLSRDAGRRGQPRARMAIRSLHVAPITASAAEVCAVIQRGARCTALALRLDAVDGRWLCTALQVG